MTFFLMYMVESCGNSVRPFPNRPSGFCEPYISTSINLNKKSIDAHFSNLQLIKFSKQSTNPRENNQKVIFFNNFSLN